MLEPPVIPDQPSITGPQLIVYQAAEDSKPGNPEWKAYYSVTRIDELVASGNTIAEVIENLDKILKRYFENRRLVVMTASALYPQRGETHPFTDLLSLDKGCPVDAQTASFFVNSGGELCRNGQTLSCSSVDIFEMADRHGLDRQQIAFMSQDDSSPIGIACRLLTEAAHVVSMAKELSHAEFDFARGVHEIQKNLDFSRFRACGEIRRNGDTCTVITSEFSVFEDETEVMHKVCSVIQHTGAHLWVMSSKSVFCDNSNKFRVRLQLELSWRVDALRLPQVLTLRDCLIADTLELWDQAGISVR